MKFAQLLTVLALSTAGASFAADTHDHGHEHKPLHGGVVVEVKDMDYELVAKPDVLQLYCETTVNLPTSPRYLQNSHYFQGQKSKRLS